MPTIAHKTMTAIDKAIYDDQGASFRQSLAVFLPKMEDAYRGRSDRFRSHFGFSTAGDSCARKLWFSFNWTRASIFPGQTLRLFNRGHLEEARFLAMLVSAGYEVHFETPEGGQFKISDHNGHAGSAIDGVVVGIPDLPEGTPALVEMKTHNQKQFNALVRKGVQESHHKHYVQMQIYMRKYNLKWGLYMAVCKNTDELLCELIYLDEELADRYIMRAGMIIFAELPPERVGASPGWYECKFCDFLPNCHKTATPEINCRTCIHSSPASNKRWYCASHDKIVDKAKQLRDDCDDHLFNPHLLNGAIQTRSDPEAGWLKIKWRNRNITLGIIDGVQYTTSKELAEENDV